MLKKFNIYSCLQQRVNISKTSKIHVLFLFIFQTAQCEGRYKEALQRSQKCLSTVQAFSEDLVPNKIEVIANLYGCIGNAYLEMGSYEKALENHHTDLRMGEAK